MRDKCVADSHLADLPARGFVAADADFKAAERERIGRRGFLFSWFVNLAVLRVCPDGVIESIGALVRPGNAIFVDAICFVMAAPGVPDRSSSQSHCLQSVIALRTSAEVRYDACHIISEIYVAASWHGRA